MISLNKKYWIGEPYRIDPNSVEFDTEISTFNPPHDPLEYESTKKSILSSGQERPIQINSVTGKCEDGVHRVGIMIELGQMVLAQKIDGNLPFDIRLAEANKGVNSGRDFTTTQKAIQALRLSQRTGKKIKESATIYKVDHRQVSYAASIKGLGREDILDVLLNNGSIKLEGMSKPSTSLRSINSFIKAEVEKDQIVQIPKEEEPELEIDYDKSIKTENGRKVFWAKYGNRNDIPVEIKKDLIRFLNIEFRLEEISNEN